MSNFIRKLRKLLEEMYGYSEPTDEELSKSLHRIELGMGSGLDFLSERNNDLFHQVMGDPIRRRR